MGVCAQLQHALRTGVVAPRLQQRGHSSEFTAVKVCAWLQDKDMVSALLDMKLQLDAVLNQAFQKNEQFSNALKEAFEKFINQRQNKYACSSCTPTLPLGFCCCCHGSTCSEINVVTSWRRLSC